MCEICDLIKGRNVHANPAISGLIEALFQKLSKLPPQPAPTADPIKNNDADFELALHVVASVEADAIIARAKSSRFLVKASTKTDGFGKAVLLKTAELLTAAAQGMAS